MSTVFNEPAVNENAHNSQNLKSHVFNFKKLKSTTTIQSVSTQ